ncbi:MAG: DNA glycosylase AlkZ-like family protein [Chitinophagaceae bacterium]
MTTTDIIRYRLFNQQIAETKFRKPEEIVNWLIAMQAQEYAMSKWAIGLRLPGSTDEMVEKSFTDGAILQTHLMRPTWHFVTATDIRWLLKLTAPRVDALNAFMYRQLELDNKLFKRSNNIIAKTLEGGKQVTRAELQAELKQKKIIGDGFRLSYLMMKAELDGIICSGARR